MEIEPTFFGLTAADLTIKHEWFVNPVLDERPLGSWQHMLYMSLLYLVIIAPLSFLMKGRKGYLSTFVAFVHNALMSAYSLYEFIGCYLVLSRNWARHGNSPRALVCDPDAGMLDGMDFWIYTFYLSKFYEWIDTIFLIVMRGKPQVPTDDWQKVLHVFHHTVTPSIVWVAWRYRLSIAWSGPLTNSIVHVIMYAYYMLVDYVPAVRRFGVLITPVQLVQFTLCIGLLVGEVYYWFSNPSVCQPDPEPVYWLAFCYVAFLALFVKLYIDKLNAPARAPRSSPASPSTKPAQIKPKAE